MRTGVRAYRSTGAQMQAPHFLALLARSLARSGRLDEGTTTLREAVEMANATGESDCTSELLRLEGELLEGMPSVDWTPAIARTNAHRVPRDTKAPSHPNCALQ